MNRRAWLVVTTIAVTAAALAWSVFREGGIAASITFCAVYVTLLSANLPLQRWIRLDALETFIDAKKVEAVDLHEPCEYDGVNNHRHTHFDEIVKTADCEKLARAYGAAKLSDKLLKDVRHDWERGIFGGIVFLFVWGMFAFAGDSRTVQAASAGSDVVKAAITAVVGFFHLAGTASVLHWFRKQNGQIV